MRVAYLDCFSGVSGDMLLGAMLDAGLRLDDLQGALAVLPVDGWSLTAQKVKRGAIAATHAVVDVRDEQPARTLEDVLRVIADARLPDADKERAAAVFRRLAEAEAAAHGMPLERVHFHEVGALDSIADIAGAAIGLDLLGVEKFTSRSVPTGHGTVSCAHGIMPIPAPGTAELLKGVPLAASRGNLLRLHREYRRTLRRACAIHDVVLPEIDTEFTDIEVQLDEMEREEALWIRAGRRQPG